MRRTLLAVGFAVLVSMLLAPHGESYSYRGHHYRHIQGVGPFFMDEIPYWRKEYRHLVKPAQDLNRPDWARDPFADLIPKTVPAGWDAYQIGPVMIDMLVLEIIFLAVLFALLMNIRWRRKRNQM